MSWNIQKPGDYLNGPLTVTGAVTFQSTLQVTGGVAGQGALIGRDGASGGGTYGSNTGNTNINSPGTVRFNVNSGTLAGQFDTSGNFGIGASPLARLHSSNGSSSDSGLFTGLMIGGTGAASARTASLIKNTSSPYDLIIRTQDFTSGTTGSLIVQNGSTEVFRVNTNGAAVLSGGNVSASGVGIAFPAAQSASTDANTLDDYEEGTWTPTIKGTTTVGTATYSVQVGTYTKVGRVVYFQGRITWSGHTGTGNMQITGIPFTSLSTTNSNSACNFGYLNNTTLSASNVMTGFVFPSTNDIGLYQYPVGGGAAGAPSMNTAADIIFSGTYLV